MASLILVQRDTSQPLKSGGFKVTLEIGALIHDASGYRFIPYTTANKPSRKAHASMFKAIPRWAQKLADARGFSDLISHDELKLAIISGAEIERA